ncbi:hypothetical protein EZS27_028958 [termite gut metagenome]|uniref:Uncharacterized protein n=1 Tax=termite gut metagenome TaxID=433724 RepID=A0A5J4QHK0_9ZZZZ
MSIASGKLYSPEHKQYFEVKDAKMKIEKEPDNPNKLRLAINEINIVDWFRQKYKEVQQRVVGNTHQVSPESKGFKL